MNETSIGAETDAASEVAGTEDYAGASPVVADIAASGEATGDLFSDQPAAPSSAENAVTDESDSDDDSDEDSDEDDGEDSDASPSRSGRRTARRGKVSLRRLEEEGEVAADYLEELLDIVDLDGDIDIDVENGRASVAIIGEDGDRDLRRLVGPRGEVLEALQELARLAVQARTGERSRMMLDVAGFRAARRRKLEDLAARACQEVQRTGVAIALEPMTAFERKVVHDVVADAGLVSASEGEDPHRQVVVHPAGA